MTREVRIDLDWIPPADVRGNALGAHRSARFASKARLRESGLAHGLEARERHPTDAWPMSGPLTIRFEVDCKRRIDGDNLLVGYKAFVDGLSDADVIRDDADIIEWQIRVRAGRTPCTRVLLRTEA